jgi:hypothetical protein
MWGPIFAWCALELLAESVDDENPERVALDLFDRLRLREPFARAFTALGFEGEAGWRAAARIKVVLLTVAGVGAKQEEPEQSRDLAAPGSSPGSPSTGPSRWGGSPVVLPASTLTDKPAPDDDTRKIKPGAPVPSHLGNREGNPVPATSQPEAPNVVLAPSLWLDPDVRWLTGVHETEGHVYLVRERYEELLWWMLMPSLLEIAGHAAPDRAAVAALARTVGDALATAEAAGYRVDKLLQSGKDQPEPEAEVEEVGKAAGSSGTGPNEVTTAKTAVDETGPDPSEEGEH